MYDVCLTDLLCVLGSCWQDLAQGVCWSSTLTSTSGTTSSRKSTEDIPWSRGPTLRGTQQAALTPYQLLLLMEILQCKTCLKIYSVQC